MEVDSICSKFFWKGQKHKYKGAVMQKTCLSDSGGLDLALIVSGTFVCPNQGPRNRRKLGTQGNQAVMCDI